MGRHADIGFRDGDLPSVEVGAEHRPSGRSDLFEAIPKRQCTRAEYDGRAASSEQLDLLREAASGPNVDMLLVTDTAKIKDIADYVVAGNTAQMADEAFLKELKAWIRFSETEVALKRDGVFSASSGNPTLPRWLGSLMFDWLFTAEAENEKYLAHINSSAGIAVFASAADDPEHWVEAGRSYQRFRASGDGPRVEACLRQPAGRGRVGLRPNSPAISVSETAVRTWWCGSATGRSFPGHSAARSIR